MDRTALEILMQKGIFFDCETKIPNYHNLKQIEQHGAIVNRYERRMSIEIIEAGFGIDAVANGQPVFPHNASKCTATDMWSGKRLRELNPHDRIPSLNETIFFKDTRYLTPELAEEIGYKAEVGYGNWEYE